MRPSKQASCCSSQCSNNNTKNVLHQERNMIIIDDENEKYSIKVITSLALRCFTFWTLFLVSAHKLFQINIVRSKNISWRHNSKQTNNQTKIKIKQFPDSLNALSTTQWNFFFPINHSTIRQTFTWNAIPSLVALLVGCLLVQLGSFMEIQSVVLRSVHSLFHPTWARIWIIDKRSLNHNRPRVKEPRWDASRLHFFSHSRRRKQQEKKGFTEIAKNLENSFNYE